MPPQVGVALARLFLQLSTVDDLNCAAVSFNGTLLLQLSDDAGGVSALDTQHLRYEILRHAQLVAADPILYRK
jgi:hypothetical protein